MAARNRSKATADDTVELEAMRKEDSSWHPCRVSLSSNGVGLIVDYGNTCSEDIIVNEKEAIARLRVRSIPLHGDDCLRVQEDEHVLAAPMSQTKRLFFDAEVEKASRIRHSKKVHCRCTFTIKWLSQDLKGGTLTVPSSSVMKLATKSIDVHPTISAFLNMLKSLHCFGTSPLPTIIDDMDSEIDLHELLEKQIEAISSSADVSKKRISDNTLLGIEVCKKGKYQCGVVAGSKLSNSHVQLPSDHNHLKRTTRSTQKLQMEMEVKDPSSTASSIEEELLQSRSLLNPLAARAALASLMSKVPQNVEVSVYHGEKLDCTYSLDNISCKLDILQPLNGTKSYNSVTGNGYSMTGKTQLLDKESENKTSETPYSSANFTCSVAKRKLNRPHKATKPTFTAKEKCAGITDDDTVETKTLVEQKGQSSTKARRFTRSAVCEVKETQNMEAKQGMEEYIPGKYTASDDDTVETKSLVEQKRQSSTKARRFTRSAVCEVKETQNMESKQGMEEYILGKYTASDDDTVETKSLAEQKGRSSTKARRFTRSAVCEVKETQNMESKQRMEEYILGKYTASDDDTVETKSLVEQKGRSSTKARRFTRSAVCEVKETQIMDAKRGMEEYISGEVVRNRESSRSLKRKCTSNKQDLRFSPRIHFLPRTRSQNKS
ncbi:hypothetical protein U1Q18_013314 [Sarracenia purpurea var. burkii]